MPKLGKVNSRVMDRILRLTGAQSSELVEGPQAGLDNSILRLRDNKVLISSTDPISFIPSLGPAVSAWLSVHAVASDVASSGLSPKYALFDLNLPPNMSDKTLLEYWRHVHLSCKDIGISIIGGHTGRFEGCDYTVVGGCAMFAVGGEDDYVTSGMAVDDDNLIATKSAAIEAASVLASTFPKTVEAKLGKTVLAKAKKLVRKITTVEDSLTAAGTGLHENGVTAMHDVTEGGVLSAVLDMAEASGLKAAIDQDAIPVSDATRQVCRVFKIDPLYSLGQGCLVIAVRPNRTSRVIHALENSGIPASLIGKLMKRRGPSFLVRNGRKTRMSRPASDPYWGAYWRGVKQRLP